MASGFRETLLVTRRTFLQIYLSFSPWGVGLVALCSPHSSWSAPQENQKQEKVWVWAIFVPCKEKNTESFQCCVTSRRPLEPLPRWWSHLVELYWDIVILEKQSLRTQCVLYLGVRPPTCCCEGRSTGPSQEPSLPNSTCFCGGRGPSGATASESAKRVQKSEFS